MNYPKRKGEICPTVVTCYWLWRTSWLWCHWPPAWAWGQS